MDTSYNYPLQNAVKECKTAAELTEVWEGADRNNAEIVTISQDWEKLTIKVVFKHCNVMGCDQPSTIQCSRCGVVPYCSGDHMRADEHVHGVWCRTLCEGLAQGRHGVMVHVPCTYSK